MSPGISDGWGRLEVSRVSFGTKKSRLLLVTQLMQHHQSAKANSNAEVAFISTLVEDDSCSDEFLWLLSSWKHPCRALKAHSPWLYNASVLSSLTLEVSNYFYCVWILGPVHEQLCPTDLLSTGGRLMLLQQRGGGEAGWYGRKATGYGAGFGCLQGGS